MFFIGRLSFKTTDESLGSHFDQLVTLDDYVIKNPNTNHSRRLFVIYTIVEEVCTVMKERSHKLENQSCVKR